MRWLVTTSADAETDDVVRRLEDLGCTEVDIEARTPLDDDEVAVPVEGPSDLAQRARAADDPLVIGVYDDSEQTLY